MPERIMVVCGHGNYRKTEVLHHAINEVAADQIVVHAVTIGNYADDTLRHAAESTGGKYHHATTAEELRAAFSWVGNLQPRIELK